MGFNFLLKFIYSEKATKFCEIFTLLLSYVVPVKSKLKITQNFVAFSEYMNLNKNLLNFSSIVLKIFLFMNLFVTQFFVLKIFPRRWHNLQKIWSTKAILGPSFLLRIFSRLRYLLGKIRSTKTVTFDVQ